MASSSYQDNMRLFWIRGLPKADIKTVGPYDWLLDTGRSSVAKKRNSDVIKLNGFTALHNKKNSDLLLDFKTEHAFDKALKVQKNFNEKRKQRKIHLIDIDDIPEQYIPEVKSKKVVAKCRAINLSNKPCQFKAVCGDFCKRHAP